MSQLGTHVIRLEDANEISKNPFFAANTSQIQALESYMDELRKAGDSCGARINVQAFNVPVGWGEPVYDRLDADIAFAMMGINAVKAVRLGLGLRVFRSGVPNTAMNSLRRASLRIMRAASWVESQPASRLPYPSR
jgi:chorismate synthase